MDTFGHHLHGHKKGYRIAHNVLILTALPENHCFVMMAFATCCIQAMVHGARMGWNPSEDDDSGTPWATGLFQCLNPNAQNVFDFDYLCTSCACPCAQFYFNWLKILEGAPVSFPCVIFLIL
jgi:hypothetical protein